MCPRVIWLASLSIVVCSLSCSSAGSWQYRPMSVAVSNGPLSGARLAVLPFTDERGDRNRALVLLYLIPLMPVGPFTYEKIESGSPYLTHSSYQIRPAEDLAKALVQELKAANVFREVFYTEREKEPEVDLFLKGTVRDMTYSGGIISYGLSAYGPGLWFLGLPAGYTTNRLSVQLQLQKPNREVVWKSTPFEDEWKLTSGLYYNWGHEFHGYPELMQRAAKLWIGELAQIAPAKD